MQVWIVKLSDKILSDKIVAFLVLSWFWELSWLFVYLVQATVCRQFGEWELFPWYRSLRAYGEDI
jgi:hypothetical protein